MTLKLDTLYYTTPTYIWRLLFMYWTITYISEAHIYISGSYLQIRGSYLYIALLLINQRLIHIK